MPVRIGVLEALLTMRDELSTKWAKAVDNIQKGADKLDATGKKIGDIGEGLTKLSAPIAALGLVSAKFATDLNVGMANVATLIPGNIKRVEELKASVQSTAIAVGKSTNDLAGGLYQTLSAFGDTAETAKLLEINAKAAAAGLSSTNEAINLTSAVTKGYGDTSQAAVEQVANLALTTVRLGQTTFPELAASMGKVVPIASALGQSQEDLFAVFATATGVTGSAAEVATQYRGVLAAILDPSDKLIDLTKELGFESAKAMLEQRGLIGTLQTIVQSAEASKLPLTDFIGSIEAVPLALALAGPQADQFASKLAEMSSASGALDEAFDEQTHGINKAGFAWQQITQKMIVAGQRIGDAILPMFVNLIDKFTPVIDLAVRGAEVFADLPAPIQSVAIAVAAIVTAAGPALIITGQLMTAWAALVPVLPMLSGGLSGVITFLTGPVGLAIALGAVLLSIDETRNEITSLASQISGYVKSSISEISVSFSSWSDEITILKDNIKPLITVIGSDLVTVLVKLIQLSGLITQSAAFGVVETIKITSRFIEWAGSSDVLANSLRAVVDILKTLIDWTNKTNSVINPLIVNWKGLLGLSQQKIEPPAPAATKVIDPWDTTGLDLTSPLKGILEQQADFAKLIGEGFKPVVSSVVTLGNAADTAKSRLAGLRAELQLQINTNNKLIRTYGDLPQAALSATEIEIQSINRKSDLQRQYLQDVETFGKSAADQLKVLRAAAHDSNAAADSMAKAWSESVERASDSWQKFDDLIEQNNQSVIDAASKFVQQASESWDKFDALIESNNAALEKNVAAGQSLLFFIEEQIAGPYQAAILSAENWFTGLIADIQRAEKAGQITAEQAANAIIAIETRLGDERVALAAENFQRVTNGIGSALSALGDLFGGFFAKLSSYVQQIQSTSSSFSAAGAAMGMSSAGTGMLAAAGAFIAVVAIAYDLMKTHAASRRARKYDNAAVLSRDDGVFGNYNIPVVDSRAFAATKAITAAIDSFAEAIGGTITKLATLEVQVRKDGKYFQAFVEGEFVGRFQSMEEAVSAGLFALFTHAETELRGLGELVAQGLDFLGSDSASLGFQTIEDAHDFLSALKEISELGLPEGAIRVQNFLQHLDGLWRKITELGQASDATAQGMGNLIGAEALTFRDWSDSITGRQRTRKEELEEKKREAAIFESTKALRIAELKLRVFELVQEAQVVRTRGDILRASAGIDRADLDARVMYAKGKAMVLQTEINVMNTWLQFIDQMITALNQLIADLEAIPAIDPDKIKLPGGKGGGQNRESVRSFIDDKRFELSLRTMGEFARQQAEISRQYDEQIEKAGKDKKLRQELLDLKEEELRLLAIERKQSTVESFQEFLGLVSPFDQVRKTAADLIKEIEDSLFGDARKARMIGRVMEEVDRQLTVLSQQSALSVFGQMISDLEAAGMKESELSDARKAMLTLEHMLKVQQYGREIDLIKAAGKLTGPQLAALEEAYNRFKDLDPLGGIDGKYDKSKNRERMAERQAEAVNTLAQELSKATDIMTKHREQGLSPWFRALKDLNRDFDIVFRAMGRNAETTGLYGTALGRLQDQFTKGLQELYDNLQTGDLAQLNIADQFANAQSKYKDLVDKFKSTGDLSLSDSLRDAGQTLADLFGQMYGTAGDTYQTFRSEMMGQIESLLGIDGSQTASILGGPQWFLKSSQEQITTSKDIADRSIDATNNVANMIDYRSSRQEQLLQQAVDRLADSVREIINVRDGVYALEDNQVSVG